MTKLSIPEISSYYGISFIKLIELILKDASTTSKKIIIYLLFLFVTINNYSINKFIYPKVNLINISGLDLDENQELLNNLNYLKSQNLFFIDKEVIQKNIIII